MAGGPITSLYLRNYGMIDKRYELFERKDTKHRGTSPRRELRATVGLSAYTKVYVTAVSPYDRARERFTNDRRGCEMSSVVWASRYGLAGILNRGTYAHYL